MVTRSRGLVHCIDNRAAETIEARTRKLQAMKALSRVVCACAAAGPVIRGLLRCHYSYTVVQGVYDSKAGGLRAEAKVRTAVGLAEATRGSWGLKPAEMATPYSMASGSLKDTRLDRCACNHCQVWNELLEEALQFYSKNEETNHKKSPLVKQRKQITKKSPLVKRDEQFTESLCHLLYTGTSSLQEMDMMFSLPSRSEAICIDNVYGLIYYRNCRYVT